MCVTKTSKTSIVDLIIIKNYTMKDLKMVLSLSD